MLIKKRILLCLLVLFLMLALDLVWHSFFYQEACWKENPHLLCIDVNKEEVLEVLKRAKDEFIFVEGGKFLYGDVIKNKSNPEAPVVPVEMSSYSISKHEVTRGDFIVFLRDTGAWKDYLPRRIDEFNDFTANHIESSQFYYKKPVQIHSWIDASSYCQWLGYKTGLPINLPSEAQWEYAARSRGRHVYYATQREGDVLIKDVYGGNRHQDWHYEQIVSDIVPPVNGDAYIPGDLQLRPVGSYPPNVLGIHDMTGNVSEWLQDWYDSRYLSKLLVRVNSGETIIDPVGPTKPVEWGDLEKSLPRKAIRDWAAHDGIAALNDTSAYLYKRGGIHELSMAAGFRCAVNQKAPLMPQREN